MCNKTGHVPAGRLKGYKLVMQRIAAIRDRAIRRETAEDFACEIAALAGVLDLNGFLQSCGADLRVAEARPRDLTARV